MVSIALFSSSGTHMGAFDNTTEQTTTSNPPVDSICSSLGIPPHLHQMERKDDEDFALTELLFRWYVPLKEIKEEGWIWIPMSGAMSVNRGRYSQHPTDVLYDIREGKHRFGQAEIAVFQVWEIRGIEIQHPTLESRHYTLEIVHAPERCMYPHTNIRVLLNGEPVGADALPKTAKTELRRKFTKVYRNHIAS